MGRIVDTGVVTGMVCVCMCVCVWLWMCGQRSTFGIFLYHSLSWVLRWSLPKSGAHCFARLPGQRALRSTCLFSSNSAVEPRVTFYEGTGNLKLVLRFAQESAYLLSHLSSLTALTVTSMRCSSEEPSSSQRPGLPTNYVRHHKLDQLKSISLLENIRQN